ncbi:MAG: hypothetical protein J5857_07840 [Treponema sp.]|nr:hypothetical protein [Treponema sp.]
MKKKLLTVILLFLNVIIFAQELETDNFSNNNSSCLVERWQEEYDLLGIKPLTNQLQKNSVQLITNSLPVYAIRIEWNEEDQYLDFWMESYKDRFENRKLDFHKKAVVSKETIEQIINLINKCDFYNQEPLISSNGRDGYSEIIEVNIDGKYWCVERWDPKQSVIKEIVEYLYELADERDRIYPPEEREADEKRRERMKKIKTRNSSIGKTSN